MANILFQLGDMIIAILLMAGIVFFVTIYCEYSEKKKYPGGGVPHGKSQDNGSDKY